MECLTAAFHAAIDAALGELADWSWVRPRTIEPEEPSRAWIDGFQAATAVFKDEIDRRRNALKEG